MNGECPVVNGDELQFAEVSQPGGGQFDEVTGVHHFGFLVLELYRERPAMSEELIVGTDRWNRSLEPIARTDRWRPFTGTGTDGNGERKSRRVHKKSRGGLLHLGGHRVELNGAAFLAIQRHRRCAARTVQSNCVSCTLVTRRLEFDQLALIISEDRTGREKQKSIRTRSGNMEESSHRETIQREDSERIQNQCGSLRQNIEKNARIVAGYHRAEALN